MFSSFFSRLHPCFREKKEDPRGKEKQGDKGSDDIQHIWLSDLRPMLHQEIGTSEAEVTFLPMGGGANRNICTAYCIITIRTQAKIELTIRSEFLSETLKIHRRERRRAGPPPQVPTKLQNWKKKTQKRERQLSRKTEETNQNAANTDWTHEA